MDLVYSTFSFLVEVKGCVGEVMRKRHAELGMNLHTIAALLNHLCPLEATLG
jgi:hypothetical protein